MSLVKFIPRYFFEALVNGIVPLISFLLVHCWDIEKLLIFIDCYLTKNVY
jgi:hypothetical protein